MLKPDIVTPTGVRQAFPFPFTSEVDTGRHLRAHIHGDGQEPAEAVVDGDREGGRPELCLQRLGPTEYVPVGG